MNHIPRTNLQRRAGPFGAVPGPKSKVLSHFLPRLRTRDSGLGIAPKGRGQATVELALVVVLLFAMLYGILEISRLLFINAELENAAREGVDYASRHPDVSASDLRNNVIAPKLALIDKSSPDFVVNNPTLPRGIGSYYPVQVTVSYNWTSMANFVPDMSAMTLRPLGPLQLTATSTKLIEGR